MIPEFIASMGATHAVAMDYASSGTVASVSLTPETILNAVAVLDKQGYLLEDVTASDLKEGFEITYHFSLFEGKSRLVLRLIVPHNTPTVPSISASIPVPTGTSGSASTFTVSISPVIPICIIFCCLRTSKGIR